MQILFYRELEFPLDRIRSILTASDYARESALSEQLHALKARQKRIEALIATATRTLNALKGDLMMKDTEKFEGFKAEIIAKNEDRYGEEIRSRYGDATVDGVNARIQGMSEETWHKAQALEREVAKALKCAVAKGNATGEAARKLCDLHSQWLNCYWTPGMYTPEAHIALAQGYVADERFAAYYNAIVPGGAAFLRDALVACLSQ
ncbi:MerR family transcriptional regulator [Eubacterium sp.]|uniref:MerR family transcriptional regulator n=1 Tax=Eubacterium sp. TaxID=142586 RepID=UPI002FC79F4F